MTKLSEYFLFNFELSIEDILELIPVEITNEIGDVFAAIIELLVNGERFEFCLSFLLSIQIHWIRNGKHTWNRIPIWSKTKQQD